MSRLNLLNVASIGRRTKIVAQNRSVSFGTSFACLVPLSEKTNNFAIEFGQGHHTSKIPFDDGSDNFLPSKPRNNVATRRQLPY